MWKLLEQVAKNASVNASSYVNSVQEKAQILAAAVQDEASTLLSNAMGSARSGPVDEILFEEVADYQQFLTLFSVEKYTHEIKRVMDEYEEIRELHDIMVPHELSDDEFWCRYFFRQQETEKHKQKILRKDVAKTKKCPEDNRDEANSCDDTFDRGCQHRPQDKQPPWEKTDSQDQEGLWLLKAARDAERHAAAQWRQKARDLHQQVQGIEQRYDEKEQKALQEWQQRLQTVCDSYETTMAALNIEIDEARAAGYKEGIRESQAIMASERQKAEEDIMRLRCEMCDSSVGKSVSVLTTEKENLQRKLITARERIVELEKRDELPAEKFGGTAFAELTQERDLWRMRALKMKKLKDLVQAELITLRQQRDADRATSFGSPVTGPLSAYTDDHSKLQTRMNDLQTQLANALAGSEARAREAYEKGIEVGKAEKDQMVKQERDLAYQEGYMKAQCDATSEMDVLKAELKMFHAFHESAAHCADDVAGNAEGLFDHSLDDISLSDGQALCSPTSSVSIFTDDGKNDLCLSEIPKSTDDWGEW